MRAKRDFPRSFDEAFEALDEYADAKKDELAHIFSSKGEIVRELYQQLEPWIKSMGGTVEKTFEDVKETISNEIETLSRETNERVSRNPWPYIGISAVGAFAGGYWLGKQSQRPKRVVLGTKQRRKSKPINPRKEVENER